MYVMIHFTLNSIRSLSILADYVTTFLGLQVEVYKGE